MKQLTKSEELLLLAICNLEEEAYGVEILNYVSQKTGSEWSIGSVYVPLDKLTAKGYVEAYLGEATQKRGGKKKRFYRITKSGLEALRDNKRVQDELWKNLGKIISGS